MPDQNLNNDENGDSKDDIIKFSKFISKVMTNITKSLPDISEQGQGSGPYDFHIRIGPDGMPVVENLQPEQQSAVGQKHEAPKEPLVDIVDEGDSLVIVAELKGIMKEDISVTAKAEEIDIAVSNSNTVYSRNIPMPQLVNPASGKAKYNNGVLEIRLKKRMTNTSYTIKVL